MDKLDTYKTIVQKSEGYYRERGSKFIALAYPVNSEDETREIVLELKKEYHNARHHCYAYVLGFEGDVWRANDDGEPSSTGGKPIHGQIISRNLTNTLVVVIRYFGGTKLGVPGLINAYREAASDALDNAEITTLTVRDLYNVSFAYPMMNDVMRMIKDEELSVIDQHFDTSCSITIGIRQSKVDLILERIDLIDSAVAEFLRTE
ncbi:MAG TPA: YigZ family protein [Bacteroidales bacterium]|nr:YigZ family protein [Bacteroidales bacterium]